MKLKALIVLGAVVLIAVAAWVTFYPDWLWFDSLGFASVFWTMLLTKFSLGLVVWMVFALIVAVNLYFARSKEPPTTQEQQILQLPISGKTYSSLILVFAFISSLVVAYNGSSRWDLVRLFFSGGSFGTADPIFSKDVGFYVFSLPFYFFVQSWLFGFFIFAALITLWWYQKDGALKISDDFAMDEGIPTSLPKVTITPRVKQHLILLGGILLLLLAWGYRLKLYKLLYSTQGPAFGASYADVNTKILAYWVLTIVSIACAVLFFVSMKREGIKPLMIGVGVWVGTVLVFALFIPYVVQSFVVRPNELAKEAAYIAHNIEYTRKAYNLDRVKAVDFPVSEALSAEDINKNDATIQNIRIWDERPLLKTYRQIQSIRLYYDFNNVDVDRYLIDRQYRQVMLAARELDVRQLPPQAKTWVNRHLIYTHGYGLAMSPVNEVTSEGLPRLLIKDLPPVSHPELKIERPEIYYGERTDEYVLVKTKAKEFDYPKGDKNVYTIYQGEGGVNIGSLFRRIMFAIEYMDPQILFTTYLGPDSKIMYIRRIDRRLASIAPFLDYDGDPYLVLVDGRLYWIQDAYTSSDMYPYSKRTKVKYKRFRNKHINYIRNSVKVIVDAYNGDVTYYVIDQNEPIAMAFSKIFPKLFKPFDAMPDGLKRHLRYPKDLFQIQVATYRTYHMDDAQVFYNQEDLWQVPDEMYADSRQEMTAYYVIIKLPEAEREEFLLMLPFTPSKKDNMIGWLAARSDLPNYGNLLVYKLPKDKLVFGPMQIEARVDQQTEISRELTLWGQRGSRVIRGNLLAIPVHDSFIYVEPVYLEAKQEEQTQPEEAAGKQRGRQAAGMKASEKSKTAALPELKRVIVAFGNRLVMEENLDTALGSVFGEGMAPRIPTLRASPGTQPLHELAATALAHFERAKTHLREGDWTGYGQELESLERVLKDLSARGATSEEEETKERGQETAQ